jgi:hypothetical protein
MATEKRGEIRLENWWVRRELKQIKTRAGMLVYAVLRTYRNHETGECYPGMKKLRTDTGLSRQAISTAVRELELLGLVSVGQGRWDKTQKYQNNLYLVRAEANWDSDIRPKKIKKPCKVEVTRAV